MGEIGPLRFRQRWAVRPEDGIHLGCGQQDAGQTIRVAQAEMRGYGCTEVATDRTETLITEHLHQLQPQTRRVGGVDPDSEWTR